MLGHERRRSRQGNSFEAHSMIEQSNKNFNSIQKALWEEEMPYL